MLWKGWYEIKLCKLLITNIKKVEFINIEDLKILSADRKSSLNKCDSHYWITKSKDFEQICWWAGWEPDNVRYRYSKALKEGLIKFKRRHLLWHEYNKLFQRLKLEKDIDIRRELRRNIENKRRQIMDADNVFVENLLNL